MRARACPALQAPGPQPATPGDFVRGREAEAAEQASEFFRNQARLTGVVAASTVPCSLASWLDHTARARFPCPGSLSFIAGCDGRVRGWCRAAKPRDPIGGRNHLAHCAARGDVFEFPRTPWASRPVLLLFHFLPEVEMDTDWTEFAVTGNRHGRAAAHEKRRSRYISCTRRHVEVAQWKLAEGARPVRCTTVINAHCTTVIVTFIPHCQWLWSRCANASASAPDSLL